MPKAIFIPADPNRPCEVVELTANPDGLAGDLDGLISGTAWGYGYDPDAMLAATDAGARTRLGSNDRATRYIEQSEHPRNDHYVVHGDAVLHGVPDSTDRLSDVPERFLDPQHLGWTIERNLDADIENALRAARGEQVEQQRRPPERDQGMEIGGP